MKVMKFGGGCLTDSEDVLKVAGIVGAESGRVVVVVSAVSGITNKLEDGLQAALDSEVNVPRFLDKIRESHIQLLESVVPVGAVRHVAAVELMDRLKKIERLLYGVAYTLEITPSVRAHVMSFGERFSALILAAALNSRGRSAEALEADRIGIVTDESFDNATARLAEVRRNLQKELLPVLERGDVPVVTGYFGRTAEGKVTTFGRNGSDYSAAVIAQALGADRLEIWKDVDGFMSADPKVVSGARPVDRLSYYEAAELSYFGARILHPRTVEPLADSPIPVVIKNIHRADGGGTEVVPTRPATEEVIKSITSNRRVAVVRIYGPGVGFKPGIIAEIGRLLAERGINIFSVLTSQTCINLILDKADARAGSEAVSRLINGIIERVELKDHVALVAAVGDGLMKRRGAAARVLARVAEENINIEMLAAGASEAAQYFVVDEEDADRAVHAIHREFFGSS